MLNSECAVLNYKPSQPDLCKVTNTGDENYPLNTLEGTKEHFYPLELVDEQLFLCYSCNSIRHVGKKIIRSFPCLLCNRVRGLGPLFIFCRVFIVIFGACATIGENVTCLHPVWHFGLGKFWRFLCPRTRKSWVRLSLSYP